MKGRATLNLSALAFETAKLLVRPLSDQDEALYCELYTDAGTMRLIGTPLSREHALRSFSSALQDWHVDPILHAVMTIVEKDGLRPVGICAVKRVDSTSNRAELGIMLHPTVVARRYSKESFGGLVAAAFEVFPIDEVWVQYSPGHVAADRLAASLGFSQSTPMHSNGNHLEQRICSIVRPYKGSAAQNSNKGDDNGGRTRVSSENGAGRAAASRIGRGHGESDEAGRTER